MDALSIEADRLALATSRIVTRNSRRVFQGLRLSHARKMVFGACRDSFRNRCDLAIRPRLERVASCHWFN
jgi:hypothetical protein